MRIRKHSAFTMIELLFVIVIAGIVGGIALEAIRQYYEGIYRTQTYTQRVNEADHILNQLSKYFENAIDISIVNMDEDAADGALVGNCEGDPETETEATAHDYSVVFVGVDVDSLYSTGKPGWSEYAKDGFNGSAITMDDANLSFANATITALYPGSNLQNSAIFNHQDIADTCDDFYTVNGNAYYTINGTLVGNTLPLLNNAGSLIIDEKDRHRKYLLRTGYGFRVLNTGEFIMFTNFRPWKGEIYSNGQRTTLGQNVASFYADFNNTNSFNDRGSVWRLKVCMRGLDENLTTNDVAQDAICRERRVRVRY